MRFQSNKIYFLILFLLVSGIYFIVNFVELGIIPATDFVQDYASAWNLRHEKDIYREEQTETVRRMSPWEKADSFHPPTVSFLLTPFSYLEYDVALLLFRILSVAAYLSAFFYLLRSSSISMPLSMALTSAVLYWYPVLEAASIGNVSLLMGAFVLLGIASLKRDREILAGVCFAFAAGLKLYPLLLLPVFIVTGRRIYFASMFFTYLMLCICTVYFGSAEYFSYYFTVISQQNINMFLNYPACISLGCFAMSFFSSTQYSQSIFEASLDPKLIATVITLIISCFVLGLLFLRKGLKQNDFAISYAVLGASVAAPILWSHSLLSILPAIISLWYYQRRLTYLCLALLSWPLIPIYREFYHSLGGRALYFWEAKLLQLPSYGLLLLFIIYSIVIYKKKDDEV